MITYFKNRKKKQKALEDKIEQLNRTIGRLTKRIDHVETRVIHARDEAGYASGQLSHIRNDLGKSLWAYRDHFNKKLEEKR